MERLIVYVGRDTSPEELEAVKAAFPETFEVEVYNETMRLSEGCELPLILDIAVNVGSNVIYAGLAYTAAKLFASGFKRDVGIRLRLLKSGEQIIISKKRVVLMKNAKQMEFPSVETLVVFLENREREMHK